MIPEAAVEAAAEHLAMKSDEDWSDDQWTNERIHDSFRAGWREQARTILEAAAPHMLSHDREQARLTQAGEVEADLDITFASDEQRRVFIELLESESGPIDCGKAEQ